MKEEQLNAVNEILVQVYEAGELRDRIMKILESAESIYCEDERVDREIRGVLECLYRRACELGAKTEAIKTEAKRLRKIIQD